MKLIHIFYKTVRIGTDEYYYGVHGIDTDKYPRFNDPYLGSGNIISASIKKYGKKAFKRSILAIFEDRQSAEELEAITVTLEMIADPLCMNIAPGGRAGVAGVPHSPEHCQKISDGQRGLVWINNGIIGKRIQPERLQSYLDDGWQQGIGTFSPEHCQNISAGKKGVSTGPQSLEQCQAKSDRQRGKTHSPEWCQAISDGQRGVSRGPISRPRTPEQCQAISDRLRGRILSPSHRQSLKDAWVRRRADKPLQSSSLESFII